MFSIVFTINKRNVMVLCDQFIEDDDRITLYSNDYDLEMEISKDDYDSFFVVNEFDPSSNTKKMLPKSWFNLEALLDEESR